MSLALYSLTTRRIRLGALIALVYTLVDKGPAANRGFSLARNRLI
jgi:hypothetical protein